MTAIPSCLMTWGGRSQVLSVTIRMVIPAWLARVRLAAGVCFFAVRKTPAMALCQFYTVKWADQTIMSRTAVCRQNAAHPITASQYAHGG